MSGLRKPAEIFGIPAVLASIVMSLAASPPAQAQQSPAVLFQNVRIFDGKNGALSAPSNVLVRNNKIERISAAAITAEDAARLARMAARGEKLREAGAEARQFERARNIRIVAAHPPGAVEVRRHHAKREGGRRFRDVLPL